MIKQEAIKHCITAMLLDLSRYFEVNAKIENVGDKRYWETFLKDLPKQYTESSNDIAVSFTNNVQVDNSSSTAPTFVNFAYLDEDNKVKAISVKAKRRQISIPLNCRIHVDNFIEAMAKTEELIDKAVKTRVFNYVIFGKMFRGQYRIQYDSSTQEKTNIDYENSENGFDIDFTLNLEMHYYATIYKTFENTKLVSKEITTDIEIPTGEVDTEGNPITQTIPQTQTIFIKEDAEILNQSDDLITKTIHRLKILDEFGALIASSENTSTF